MTNLMLVPDGMRRWSVVRGVPLDDGHKAMADKLVEFTDWAKDDGITTLYVATSSAADLGRPGAGVMSLLAAFDDAARRTRHTCAFDFSGALDLVPKEYLTRLEELRDESAKEPGFTLHYVLGMSPAEEIIQLFHRLNGKVPELTGKILAENAYVPQQVDYFLRTGGAVRMSSFFPLMSPHAELHFSPVLFPDLQRADFDTALKDLRQRERFYGDRPA